MEENGNDDDDDVGVGGYTSKQRSRANHHPFWAFLVLMYS